MDLDTNLEIGDRIFAGEEVFARAFAVRSSFHLQLQFFCTSNWNGLLVAHLVRPMETTTSVDQKETDRQTVVMM